MRRRQGDTQSRRAFRDGWITDRRNEKPLFVKRARQTKGGLFIARDPWKDRAGHWAVGFLWQMRLFPAANPSGGGSILWQAFLHQLDLLPKLQAPTLAFGRS